MVTRDFMEEEAGGYFYQPPPYWKLSLAPGRRAGAAEELLPFLLQLLPPGWGAGSQHLQR